MDDDAARHISREGLAALEAKLREHQLRSGRPLSAALGEKRRPIANLLPIRGRPAK
jgi:hypothetical protein